MITAKTLFNIAYAQKLISDRAAILQAQPYLQPLVNLCKRRAKLGYFDYFFYMPSPSTVRESKRYESFSLVEWQILVHGLTSLGYKVHCTDLDDELVENMCVRVSWENCTLPVAD